MRICAYAFPTAFCCLDKKKPLHKMISAGFILPCYKWVEKKPDEDVISLVKHMIIYFLGGSSFSFRPGNMVPRLSSPK